MHACGYEVVSTCIHSGALALPKHGSSLKCHAWTTNHAAQVIGLLDRLPGRGEYQKVNRCDTNPNFQVDLLPLMSCFVTLFTRKPPLIINKINLIFHVAKPRDNFSPAAFDV